MSQQLPLVYIEVRYAIAQPQSESVVPLCSLFFCGALCHIQQQMQRSLEGLSQAGVLQLLQFAQACLLACSALSLDYAPVLQCVHT